MKYPSKYDLVECWLKTYHEGNPCIVFFHHNEAKRASKIAKKFKIAKAEMSCMIAGEICIIPYSNDDIHETVHLLDEKEYGFVVSWDGENFATQNT